VPDEGTMVWTDNVCIPTGAPNPENAHTFINYILDAKVNAEIANFIHYGTANIAAKKYIVKEDLANPAIYPSPAMIAKSESVVDVGDNARLYDEAWVAIQAG
jgi:spermidine/putrescine transport system substrate-binding protein